MKRFAVQMIDRRLSSDWWKTMIEHFVGVGDLFEIRCWKEELSEIAGASCYGKATEDGNEVSIKGSVTCELLEELLTEEPADQTGYNKMTKYFTVNVHNPSCDIQSAHYGTEMYLQLASAEDVDFFERVMNRYPDGFCIGVD